MIFFEIKHGTSTKIITEIKRFHNAALHFWDCVGHFREELMVKRNEFDW
jgi:hypothetical protein